MHQKAGVFLGSSPLASRPHHYTCLNFSGSEGFGLGPGSSLLVMEMEEGRGLLAAKREGNSMEEAVGVCI